MGSVLHDSERNDKPERMKILEFFQEASGSFSMTRLITFINVLVAAFITVANVIKPEPITVNDLTLIFEVWVLTYAGKHAGKYLEKNTK